MTKVKKRPTLFRGFKKNSLLLLSFVLIVALVGGVYYYKSTSREVLNPLTDEAQETIKFAPATETEKEEAEARKLQQFDSTTSAENNNSPNQSDATGSTVKISNLYQDSSTKDIVVQTELTGSGWEQCSLSATKGSQTVTKTAKAIYQSSYSSCLGFAIGSEEFPSSGDWKFSLTAIKTGGEKLTSSIKIITLTR